MLISLKPRHLCPACSEPQIADCYFAALRIPIFGRKRPKHYCPVCKIHIWYHAGRSVSLMLTRILAIAILLPWGLSIPAIASVQFGSYFVACILLGTTLMLTEIFRGTVVAKPPNALFLK